MFSIFFDISDRVFSRLLRWNTVNMCRSMEIVSDVNWEILRWKMMHLVQTWHVKRAFNEEDLWWYLYLQTTERGYSITDNFIIEAGNGCNFYWTKFSPLFNIIANTQHQNFSFMFNFQYINLTWNECVCGTILSCET